MNGFYPVGEYDIAGFAVGAVEKSEIITEKRVKEGDVLIGLCGWEAGGNKSRMG